MTHITCRTFVGKLLGLKNVYLYDTHNNSFVNLCKDKIDIFVENALSISAFRLSPPEKSSKYLNHFQNFLTNGEPIRYRNGTSPPPQSPAKTS